MLVFVQKVSLGCEGKMNKKKSRRGEVGVVLVSIAFRELCLLKKINNISSVNKAKIH